MMEHNEATGTRVAALMACFNRKAFTLACLDALYAQHLAANTSLDIYLLDDASSDGTAEAVRAAFPEVHLLEGDGSCFWNGGMSRAFAEAMRDGYDAYLWVNDDTLLKPDTIARLISTEHHIHASSGTTGVVLGSVQDPETGVLTYGGLRRSSRWHPLKFDMAPPVDEPLLCDTMHGNCVYIPAKVANSVGNMDRAFKHSFGDIDYGLRVRKAGFGLWTLPGFAGTCARNPIEGTWEDTTGGLMERWRRMNNPKGLPPAEWMHLARKHAGPLWPAIGSIPYFRLVASSLFPFRNRSISTMTA